MIDGTCDFPGHSDYQITIKEKIHPCLYPDLDIASRKRSTSTAYAVREDLTQHTIPKARRYQLRTCFFLLWLHMKVMLPYPTYFTGMPVVLSDKSTAYRSIVKCSILDELDFVISTSWLTFSAYVDTWMLWSSGLNLRMYRLCCSHRLNSLSTATFSSSYLRKNQWKHLNESDSKSRLPASTTTTFSSLPSPFSIQSVIWDSGIAARKPLFRNLWTCHWFGLW